MAREPAGALPGRRAPCGGAFSAGRMSLEIGAVTRLASPVRTLSHPTHTYVDFTYTVAVFDSDTDGVSIPANSISGPTWATAGGSTISRNHAALSDQSGHLVDGGGAAVIGVALNSPLVGDTFGVGERIEATVTFNRAVDVTGTPRVALTIGSNTRQADYNRGHGTTSLVFRYTVVSGDADTDGISIGGSALALNSGTIRRSGSTTNASLGLVSHAVSNSSDHKVNGSLSRLGVASVALNSPVLGDTFERGEVIEATVTFSVAMDVTGAPQLALTIGANTRQASYATGDGTTSLAFRYTVVSGDADTDGISIGGSALALNSGTIRVSGDTINAALGLGSSAISNSANHKVNGATVTAPAVSGASIASRPAGGGEYGTGERIEVRVTFNRAVDVTGTPQLALTIGAATRQANYATGTGMRTLAFSYTVVAGDVDADGISVAADALTLNGGGINDARSATTAAGLGLGTNAISDAAGHQVNGMVVDDGDGGSGGPPPSQVSGVRVSPLDGGLRVSWSAAAGPVDVSQYRVDVADAAGERVRRVYTEADVFEAVVDGLANGVEYTVTVSAVPGHGGENGPPSEPRTATPRTDAGDTEDVPGAGDTEDVPVPSLPLAGAGVLAGLLASAAYRLRRAGGRAPS